MGEAVRGSKAGIYLEEGGGQREVSVFGNRVRCWR